MIEEYLCIVILGLTSVLLAILLAGERDLWNYVAHGEKVRAAAETDRYMHKREYNGLLKISSVRLITKEKDSQ